MVASTDLAQVATVKRNSQYSHKRSLRSDNMLPPPSAKIIAATTVRENNCCCDQHDAIYEAALELVSASGAISAAKRCSGTTASTTDFTPDVKTCVYPVFETFFLLSVMWVSFKLHGQRCHRIIKYRYKCVYIFIYLTNACVCADQRLCPRNLKGGGCLRLSVCAAQRQSFAWCECM